MIKYYLLLFLFIGCQPNDKRLGSIMTNCYWDIHDTHSAANGRIAYCYKFDKNGSCSYLFTPDKNGKRDEFNFDDNIPTSKTWKLQGDTLLYILGIERRIINFSNDEILLENPVTRQVDTLLKNCK